MTTEPDPAARPLRPSAIDWHLAAQLFARGLTPQAVARQAGCSRSQASRKLHHDPVFRALVAELRKADEPGFAERLARLSQSVHQAIETEVRSGNVRVVLWLADRLKLMSPKERAEHSADLSDLLRNLSKEELREFASLQD